MDSSLQLFDRLHEEFRRRHYSDETEKSYIYWIQEFIRFHNLPPPRDLGREAVESFLTHLAVDQPSFPNGLIEPLTQQLQVVKRWHDMDLNQVYGAVVLPHASSKQYLRQIYSPVIANSGDEKRAGCLKLRFNSSCFPATPFPIPYSPETCTNTVRLRGPSSSNSKTA